jgi:integrase
VLENGVESRKSRETILGLVSEMTKSDAEEALRKIIREKTHAPNTREMTFGEFLNKTETGYVASRKQSWRPHWANVLDSLYRNHFEKTIGQKKQSAITRADFQAWLNGKSHLSKSTIHKCRTQLGAILQEAFAQDLVEKNRAKDLTMPASKVAFVETGFITKQQVALGLKITGTYKSKRDYLVLRLAATRGLRPCEIFALRVNDITRTT